MYYQLNKPYHLFHSSLKKFIDIIERIFLTKSSLPHANLTATSTTIHTTIQYNYLLVLQSRIYANVCYNISI